MTLSRRAAVIALFIALAETTQAAQSKFCHTRFDVQNDGTVRWDGVRYKLDESLRPRLAVYRRQHPDCSISFIMQPDHRVATLGAAIKLLAEADLLPPKIGFLTEPRNP